MGKGKQFNDCSPIRQVYAQPPCKSIIYTTKIVAGYIPIVIAVDESERFGIFIHYDGLRPVNR